MADAIMDMFRQLPPVARTVATASLAMSVPVNIGLISIYHVLWHTSYLWKLPPQIWRIPTSFLLTGPGFGMILDPYFLFRYISELEVGNPRFPRKEDLVWYMMFVAVSLVTITELAWRYTPLLTGPYYMFLPGFIMALCYTANQDLRGRKASFWFFTVPAQLVPYCMILMSLLSPGGIAFVPLQVAGLIVAHLWDFLTRLWPEFGGGRNLLPTPGWVSYIVQTPRILRRDYGTAFRPSETAGSAGSASGRSTGVSSGGPLPEAWRTRGPGRRLGGE